MARKKKSESLTAAVSAELKANFDLNKFKEKKCLTTVLSSSRKMDSSFSCISRSNKCARYSNWAYLFASRA
jgi:hypothetical protein